MVQSETSLTLILGAMPSEVRVINERLSNKSEGQLECFPYMTGKIGKQKVVVAVTGVGVTNGAMVATLFIHHFKPTELIVSGTGSRFNPRIRTGDTVISNKTIHHAAGTLTAQGMTYRKVRGPLPGQMTHWAYQPDPALFKLAKLATKSYEAEPVTVDNETYTPKVLPGVVSASDLFGVSQAKINDMKKKLDPDIMEMESAAIAQVCQQLGTPHIVFRAGSNRTQVNPGNAYRKVGQTAASAAARWTVHFVTYLGDIRALS
jgi:adenosylhomocysteine nucleosidase